MIRKRARFRVLWLAVVCAGCGGTAQHRTLDRLRDIDERALGVEEDAAAPDPAAELVGAPRTLPSPYDTDPEEPEGR